MSRFGAVGLWAAVLLAVALDVREHVRYRGDLARGLAQLNRLGGDVQRLDTSVQRLVLASAFNANAQVAAPACACPTTAATAAPETRPSESPPAQKPVDWTAYERAKSLLEKASAGAEWTQADANEFRVAAHAAGGDKTVELLRLRVAALNAQKIRGNFVP